MALLGMKTQNMSWKEMDEALPSKGLEEIKKKYSAVYGDAPPDSKPKEGESKEENEKKDEKEEAKAKATEEPEENAQGKKGDKEGKTGKKNQKDQKGQKDKKKAEEAKPEEAKGEEAKADETKGILKAKPTAEERGIGGELKSIDGHPVIFVDDDEELSFEEVSLGVSEESLVRWRLMFAAACASLWPACAL